MPTPVSLLLGVAQDSGHPQAGCQGPCCAAAWANPELGHRAVSLAIIDPRSGERWLIEASPDFPRQLHALEQAYPRVASPVPLENTGLPLRAPPLDRACNLVGELPESIEQLSVAVRGQNEGGRRVPSSHWNDPDIDAEATRQLGHASGDQTFEL